MNEANPFTKTVPVHVNVIPGSFLCQTKVLQSLLSTLSVCLQTLHLFHISLLPALKFLLLGSLEHLLYRIISLETLADKPLLHQARST